jgi:predicted permease
VGTTVVLLIGATLLVRSYQRLTGEELGFEPEAVISALVVLPDGQYPSAEERDELYRRLLDAVRAQRGVVAATSTYSPPMARNDLSMTLLLEGEEDREDSRWAHTVIIRDDYFETLGISLAAGRDFDADDRLGAPLVAVVNETMAREFWPGEDPLGKRFTHSGGLRGSLDGFERQFFPREPYTVVGVSSDMRNQDLSEAPGALFYRPHTQLTWGTQFLLVKVQGDVAGLAGRLPDLVWETEPGLAVTQVTLLENTLSSRVALPRFRMLLLLAFAGSTCVLALVGLYGVVALNVARRRREMGLRLALGATRQQVLGLVLGRGVRLAGMGAGVGCLLAFLVSDSVESLLYDVAVTDGFTYVAVALAVLGAALAASWLPAARAGRVDPMRSLTEE